MFQARRHQTSFSCTKVSIYHCLCRCRSCLCLFRSLSPLTASPVLWTDLGHALMELVAVALVAVAGASAAKAARQRRRRKRPRATFAPDGRGTHARARRYFARGCAPARAKAVEWVVCTWEVGAALGVCACLDGGLQVVDQFVRGDHLSIAEEARGHWKLRLRLQYSKLTSL